MSDNKEDKLALLYIEDINSIISFKDWIKKNLPSFVKRDPTENEIERFLDFVEDKKRDQIRPDKAPDWRDRIKTLRMRVRKQH
jgi:hypothetical protein